MVQQPQSGLDRHRDKMMNLVDQEQHWEQDVHEHRNYLQDGTRDLLWRQQAQDHYRYYQTEVDEECDYYHYYHEQEDYYRWEEHRQDFGRDQRQGRRGGEECVDKHEHEPGQRPEPEVPQVKELGQEQKPRKKSYLRDLEDWRQLKRKETMKRHEPKVQNLGSCPELFVATDQQRRTSREERRQQKNSRKWGSVVAGTHFFLCNLMRPINQ